MFHNHIVRISYEKSLVCSRPELQFLSYQQNKALVYPCTLEMRNVIIDNFELNSELKSTSSKGDSEESVIQVAKLLRECLCKSGPVDFA